MAPYFYGLASLIEQGNWPDWKKAEFCRDLGNEEMSVNMSLEGVWSYHGLGTVQVDIPRQMLEENS